MKSNRQQDYKKSKEVELFLDKIYTRYSIPFKRITDKETQLKGIDVIFNETQLIDEKCATDYMNRTLKTYALELRASNRNGHRYEGWLINDSLDTTHYNLCYLDKVEEHPEFRAEHILEMELIMVSKQAILDYLESFGLTKVKLKEICDRIDSEGLRKEDTQSEYKFSKSNHKAEAPINILIPRKQLRKLSIMSRLFRK